jgi:hypothetical protein
MGDEAAHQHCVHEDINGLEIGQPPKAPNTSDPDLEPEPFEHAHHVELHEAHRAAREESVERLQTNEERETQQAISSALARLELFTAGHERAIGIYLAECDHKPRLRALDRATDLRRAQVLALQKLVSMPAEALLANEDFVALARVL